jgi:serine/threonine-protein kinase RIO1
MTFVTMKNDPSEMKLARDSSWLCEIFQGNNMTVEDKQNVIRSLKREHKEEEEDEDYGQSDKKRKKSHG